MRIKPISKNMENFRKLKLSENLLRAIHDSRFEKPSEIQEKTIPLPNSMESSPKNMWPKEIQSQATSATSTESIQPISSAKPLQPPSPQPKKIVRE